VSVNAVGRRVIIYTRESDRLRFHRRKNGTELEDREDIPFRPHLRRPLHARPYVARRCLLSLVDPSNTRPVVSAYIRRSISSKAAIRQRVSLLCWIPWTRWRHMDPHAFPLPASRIVRAGEVPTSIAFRSKMGYPTSWPGPWYVTCPPLLVM
jgi:hypothetical protein